MNRIGLWGLGIGIALAGCSQDIQVENRAMEAEALWVGITPMIEARASHAAVRLDDGRVVVMGGSGADGTVLNSVEIYDPSTNQWTMAEPMAQARFSHVATLLPDGRVLVSGGISQTKQPPYLDTVEIFDAQARCGWTWSGPIQMNRPHTAHTITLLAESEDGIVSGFLVGGDGTFNKDIAETFEYHLGECDTQKAIQFMHYPQAGRAHHGHSATLLPSGEVLIAGGYDPEAPLSQVNKASPSAKQSFQNWQPIDKLSEERTWHSATLLDAGPNQGKVLIAGGGGLSYALYSDTWIFDTQDNSYSKGPLMLGPQSDAKDAWFMGKWIVAGGYGSKITPSGKEGVRFLATSQVERFDPELNEWQMLPDLPEPRVSHSLTTLQNPENNSDHSLLVAGGVDSKDRVLDGAAILYLNEQCELKSDCSPGLHCLMNRCVQWQ